MTEEKAAPAADALKINEAEFTKAQERARLLEAQLTDAQKQLDRWKGFDPDAVRGKLEDYELMRREKAGNPEEIQRLVQEKETEIDKRYATKLTETERERDRLNNELRRLQVLNPALQTIGPHCTKDGLALISPIIERELGIVDGEICVIDADGKPLPSALDPRNKRMGLDEYTDQLKGRFPSVFASQSIGGTKGPGQKLDASAANGITKEKFLSMTSAERAQLPDAQRRALAAQALGMKIAQPQQQTAQK